MSKYFVEGSTVVTSAPPESRHWLLAYGEIMECHYNGIGNRLNCSTFILPKNIRKSEVFPMFSKGIEVSNYLM